jgi:lipoate-protein ligase A
VNVSIDPDRTVATQMARDHQLFERALWGEFSARIYQWDQTWITLGRFQKPEETLIEPLITNWTIRETGGAAVLHGHDLTVAIAIPLCGSVGVRAVYRQLVTPLVQALQDAGLDATLGEDAGFADRQTGAYCFLGKSENDVVSVSTGQKLCGCALKVTREAALLQASIPMVEPVVRAKDLIKDSGDDLWVNVDASTLAQAIRDRVALLT